MNTLFRRKGLAAAVVLAALGLAGPAKAEGPSSAPVEATAARKGPTTVAATSIAAQPLDSRLPSADGAGVTSASAPEPAPAGSRSTEDPAAHSHRLLAYAAIELGAAGVIAGAIAAGMAAEKHSILAGQCQAGHCVYFLQPSIDVYHADGTVATVGLIAGGALVAAGVYLLGREPKTPDEAAQTALIRPVLGPGFAGLSGRF